MPLSDTLTRPLTTVDWDDAAQVEQATRLLLTTLAADRDALDQALDAALRDPHLRTLCEHYDILDKIVLHDDPTGFRVRLHLFLPGHYDRPHNHRWTYSALLLAGSYTHTLYGTDDGFDETTDVGKLTARMVRTESTGSSYTLHHTMVHAAVAEPYTVSLIVRGPAVKDRFLVTDRESGQVWWQHGAAQETPEQAAAKRMDPDQITATIAKLRELTVI